MTPEERAAYEGRVDRLHKMAARDRKLIAAGQAALDWAHDTGACHFCGYDKSAKRPYDAECPLLEMLRELDA